MDLNRIFETVDKERLLTKLYQYGITGIGSGMFQWNSSYLSDNKLHSSLNVQINGKTDQIFSIGSKLIGLYDSANSAGLPGFWIMMICATFH